MASGTITFSYIYWLFVHTGLQFFKSTFLHEGNILGGVVVFPDRPNREKKKKTHKNKTELSFLNLVYMFVHIWQVNLTSGVKSSDWPADRSAVPFTWHLSFCDRGV